MRKSRTTTANSRANTCNNSQKDVKKMKPSNPKTTTTLHPPYFQMISEAITALKERTGSSQQAITKFVEGKYGATLPQSFNKMLSVQLKRLAKEGRVTKVKNSYKICSTTAKTTNKAETKTKVKVKNSNEISATATSASATVKSSSKVGKMKRLSQVKTPEALTKKKKAVLGSEMAKMKRLSQVTTPEALKKKNEGSVSKSKISKMKK